MIIRTLEVLLFAIAEVESGHNDEAVGLAGECSRYQITERAWKEHTKQPFTRASNRRLAEEVATAILKARIWRFRNKRGCEPHATEVYALWHRPGAFARSNYNVQALSFTARERCERFASVAQAELKKW
jgi:hypothetical protein